MRARVIEEGNMKIRHGWKLGLVALIGVTGLVGINVSNRPVRNVMAIENNVIWEQEAVSSAVLADEGLAVSEATVGSELYHALCLNLIDEGGVSPSVLYTNSFYNAGLTHLNLSIAKLFPGTSPEYKNGLNGLKLFNLTHIQSIDLSGSKLTTFNASDIVPDTVTWNNLTSIDLSNNQLESVSFGNKMNNLNNINLANNRITQVDARAISAVSSGNEIDINLANNRVSDINKVELPYFWKETPTITVNVTGNALKEKPATTEKRIYQYGLQNLSLLELTSVDNIEYEQIEGVKAYVYQVEKQEGLEDVLTEYKVLDESTTLTLPVDNYRVRYFDKTTNSFISEEEDSTGFVGYEFLVKPTIPSYKVIVGGKEYDNYSKTINGRPKLKLFGGQGTLYYSVSGGEWKEASEGEVISLKQYAGKYSVRIKNVENEIDSQYVTVSLSTSLNAYIPDLLLLVLIIAIILVIAFVGLPLLKKYVIR